MPETANVPSIQKKQGNGILRKSNLEGEKKKGNSENCLSVFKRSIFKSPAYTIWEVPF